jgi:L-malate glycosyltransferase
MIQSLSKSQSNPKMTASRSTPIRDESSAAALPRRPIRVLFCIDTILGAGGAELSLSRLIRNLPPEYECQIVTFNVDQNGEAFLPNFACPVEHLHLNNMYDWNAFKVALQIRKRVRERQIDIVHTFFQTSDLWAGPIAKWSGAKILISSRRDMGILRGRQHRILYRLCARFYDQVHAVSEGVRQFTIQTDGVPASRIVTIPNGIEPGNARGPLEQKELRGRLDIEASAPVILNVGNIRPIKGQDVLLRAAATVAQALPEVRFVSVGGFGSGAYDTFKNEILALHDSLQAGEWWRFAGSSPDVPAFLGMSNIFVLPSRSEGMSNALLEAMMAGLPCIATSVGGNPEVVVDGVTGYLIPPDDAELLAARMLELLADPEKAQRMGAAGRERAMRQFSAEIMATNVARCYEQLLEAKGRRSGKAL